MDEPQNSEFAFQSRPPRAALAPFVRRLWYARGRIPYRRDHILPHGAAVLLVNLGAPHATTPGAGRPILLRDAWVCGVQTRALVNEPLGETHVVGASFATAGAAAFFGLPMSELSDRVAPLDELWGRRARELRERLFDAPTASAKLECLERSLLARMLPTPRGLARIEEALRRLLVPGPAGVATVAHHVDLSPKHLISEFHRIVGISPLRLARIARLRRLLDKIDARNAVPWAELAAEQGWSDQAHLIRDFKTFSGVTPGEYVRRRREVFGAQIEPGQDAIFMPSTGG